MAPDNITGRSSQIIPVRPPANVRVVTVPMVPMPKMVATMPANEVDFIDGAVRDGDILNILKYTTQGDADNVT